MISQRQQQKKHQRLRGIQHETNSLTYKHTANSRGYDQ